MKLNKPLIYFDLESTGLSLSEDRIIEINMFKEFTVEENDKGSEEAECYFKRINPDGRKIAEEAFGKHGIKEEELLECPFFRDVAQEIFAFIKDCDFAGYNCKKFDIPLLLEELLRCGIHIRFQDFKVVDVYKILSKAEPRTLEGTYKRFLKKEMKNAHSSTGDVFATIEVLKEMIQFYNLPNAVDELHEYTFDQEVDLEGKLKKNEKEEVIFTFGKHKGRTIDEVYTVDRSYYEWIIFKSDMMLYTKNIFKNILHYLDSKR
jgi:DNA polymerase-3 subunit epsilon